MACEVLEARLCFGGERWRLWDGEGDEEIEFQRIRTSPSLSDGDGRSNVLKDQCHDEEGDAGRV